MTSPGSTGALSCSLFIPATTGSLCRIGALFVGNPLDQVDVFQYLDYRAFLHAYYLTKKEGGSFSHRAFSRRAGLRSPNYLKLVIDGERNLSPEMAERFASACRLKGDAASYFVKLVAFCQARSVDERNGCYQALRAYAPFRKAHALTLAQDRYHSRWYYPAIRELIAAPQFKEDPNWLAAQLIPPTTPAEASEAITTLLELGLAIRDEDGKLRQTARTVCSTAETQTLNLANYHRSMIDRARSSIEQLGPHERSVSSVTLCVGPGWFERYREAIDHFRRDLLEMEASEPEPRQVVQINLQLFPLTRDGE